MPLFHKSHYEHVDWLMLFPTAAGPLSPSNLPRNQIRLSFITKPWYEGPGAGSKVESMDKRQSRVSAPF